MTKQFTAALFLILAIAGNVAAQEAKEPLRKAKVGDYAVLKLSGGGVQGTLRQEVTAVTETKVTIKTTSTINGTALPASEQTVDKTAKYDPTAGAIDRKDIKFVETGSGEETLTIGGKAYKCDWRANSVTVTQGGVKIVTDSKVWISADAPVYGLVKTENKVFGQTAVMELTESSNK